MYVFMYVGHSRKLGSTFPSCVWYFFCADFLAEKQAYFLFYEHPIGEELPYVWHFSKYVGERVWNSDPTGQGQPVGP